MQEDQNAVSLGRLPTGSSQVRGLLLILHYYLVSSVNDTVVWSTNAVTTRLLGLVFCSHCSYYYIISFTNTSDCYMLSKTRTSIGLHKSLQYFAKSPGSPSLLAPYCSSYFDTTLAHFILRSLWPWLSVECTTHLPLQVHKVINLNPLQLSAAIVHSGLSPEGGAFALADEAYAYVIRGKTALSAVLPYHCINLPKIHA